MNIGKTLKSFKFSALSQKSKKVVSKPRNDKIIAKIVGEFKDSSRKDINKWREALETINNIDDPRWADYHDLLDDLMTDGHLQAQIQIRKLATKSSKFIVLDKKTGKEVAEKTEWFKSSWFYNFLDLALDYFFKGYRVLELTDTGKMNFELLPPRNIVPTKKIMLLETTGDKGIHYNDNSLRDYIIEIGEPSYLGILNDIIPQLIWKRNAQQSWAEFSERFGMPLITATTTQRDAKELDKIEEMLSQLGEAAQAVFPEGTNIDIKNDGSKDAYQVYDKQIDRTNSEISKPIVGGTMVSDNGSSKSQSEVHERTLDNKISESDRVFIEFLVNDKLIPIMNKFGFNFSENEKWSFDRSQAIPIKDHWAIVKEALREFDIDEKWISKTFNIPILGKKKKEDSANFKKPLSNEKQAEASYNFPNINDFPKAIFKAESKSFNKEIESLQNEILDKTYHNKNCDKEIFQKSILVGKHLTKGLHKGWGDRRLKIDYNATDHKALAFMEYNLFHFSHARELAGLAKINELLIDKEKLQIRNFSDFKRQAEPFVNKLNTTWLETEYDFSIAVGQNASSYHRFLSEKDTVTKYIKYQTAGDNEVRDEHALLDGLIFNIEDPEARRIWPPNAWRCRCEFIQYLGKAKTITSGKQAIKILEDALGDKQKKIMLKNRGDIGQVFTFDQFYMAYKEKDFNKKINDLKFTDYGLDPFSKIAKDKSEIILDETITGANVKDLFKKKKNTNYMGFKDYLNRKVILTNKVFKNHTKGKYLNSEEQRHLLFPHLEELLKSPDEIYMRSKGGKTIQLRYVKFYKQKMFISDVSINEGRNILEIQNWYSAKDKLVKGKVKEDLNHVRVGLKIK
ncbi:MAG: DUF935 family protein [Marinifilaceae bacterium]|jgi:SPP1 gp7 family putative phage head morphogenesis protein|nr:DUF935 family protein [Marinifilaceae bacterium]